MNASTAPFSVTNSIGETIIGDVHFASDDNAKPLIIVIHGFRVHKDWGFYPYIAQHLVARGSTVVTFNFSLNGYSGLSSDLNFDVTRFARNTISQECSDAVQVFQMFLDLGGSKTKDRIVTDTLSPEVIVALNESNWNGDVFLLGHSRGAGIALLIARHFNAIRRIVLWSPLSDFDRYTPRQKKMWREQGFVEVPEPMVGDSIRINVSFLDDLEMNKEKFSLTRAIALLTMPVDLIAGEQDLATPLREAQLLASHAIHRNLKLHVLPGCGHTFGITHPFTGTTAALQAALALTTTAFALNS